VLGVRIRRSVHLAGEMTSTVGNLEARDADRANARPASIWRVDLGGRIPVQQVLLTVGVGVFSRPFRLEAADDPAAPVLLASGELTRREGAAGPLAVGFPERSARHLKLTVIDDRNAPLLILWLTAEGAVRQVVFDGASAAPGVMRLYYGNARALAPRYDFGRTAACRIGVDRDQAHAGAPARQSGLSSGAETVFRAVSVAGVRRTGGCRDRVGRHPGEPGAGVGSQRSGWPIGCPAARSAGPRGQLV